jgi:riboflavin synthase
MFTGIIEALGTVIDIRPELENKTFWIQSPISSTFKVDQSVSHNGVCLTVEEIKENAHRVTAVSETLEKSTLDSWENGKSINLETCLSINGKLDGHLVQGHVDARARVIKITDGNGSRLIEFRFPKKFAPLVIEKGSIAVDGTSLTAFNVRKRRFTVAVIPFTLEHTNLRYLQEDEEVNLEFDLIGKYIFRKLSLEK